MSRLDCGKFSLELDRPLIMGIVNLTPDSFSGDGVAAERALAHAHAQIAAGADILDLGAESTRPGAPPTPLDEELRRLLPVLEGLADCGVPVSIDTYKPEVMRAAIAAGAAMINDIEALCRPGALEVVAASDVGVCLMHMQGQPVDMQHNPQYADVVGEVRDFLAQRLAATDAAGIARSRIVLDPGFCFGKTVDDNYAMLRRLPEFAIDGLPVLVGMSRKSMLGAVTGRPVDARVPASVAAALIAAQRGARILRVHDVAATRDALAVWRAVAGA